MNITLVVVFIVLGGAFAASEIALVSLRESQLLALAKRGRRGQAVAKLARDPNTFLAAVQIGVTLSGFFSAAFGATALAPVLEDPLRDAGMDPVVAGTLAVVAMTFLVAYLSLVFGELAPKRLALQKAEGFALAISPIIGWMAVVLKPLIWVVGVSSDAVVRVLGGDPSKRTEELSDEELLSIVESHEGLGEEQREILADVLDAAEQSLVAVMRPRGEVATLRSTDSIAQARKQVQKLPYSRYPVITKSLDDCESFVHVRDLMRAKDDSQKVGHLARSIPILPASMRVFPALSHLRAEGKHIALVVDEYGGADGLVTLEDLVEELIGEVYDEHDSADRLLREQALQPSGTYPGDMSLRDFEEVTGCSLPKGPYLTLAGYLLAEFGRIPREGEEVTVDGVSLTVSGMDNRRIASVEVKTEAGDGTHTAIE